eukprot:CAMPEP_0185801206 /NCGR_PEP_ID=MMETSP1322-20130828/1313_1 /TAXON_ID=265543 /ORGANISM="Minutocellus polymorphus, Strain RCC2270" /LENGTH=322 /DNA_ID=CAMNT_0028496895 /DNA_START=43 /DNA_END=1011 /DNA_ORIENTATION=-
MADFLAAAEKAIPAEVHMISGCMDSQTSADVSNVASFSLPDPAGKAGGALTSSLLKVLYSDHHAPAEDLSFQDVLTKVKATLSGRYTQIPQLSSSRPMDISSPFEIVPKGCTGTKRALLIGINYIGQQGQLSGCHNDVLNMVEYLKDVHGFESQNITLLLDDDGQHTSPTHSNILSAYRRLVAESAPGDAVYCHYSGHGGKLRDDDGDEKDGYDETLVPLDYQSAGQIRDDELFNTLVGPMRKGVTLTCIMDCCHSGTILDLPYIFKADGEQTEMTASADFDMQPLLQLAAALASGASLTEALSSQDPQQLMSIAQQCCTIL